MDVSKGQSTGAGGKSRRRRSKGGAQPTKHDAVMCGRKNVESIAEVSCATLMHYYTMLAPCSLGPQHFPLSFPAGDVADERRFYRVPNPVYNSLKLHALKEEQRSQRLHDKKEHATHVQSGGGGGVRPVTAVDVVPPPCSCRNKLWMKRLV